jgi:hypothetical protein
MCYIMQPNALGVKVHLAATEPRPRPPTPTGQVKLQLLVGLPAYRCGLTRFLPPRAMEFTVGPSYVRRPITGSASPACEEAMAGQGAATAPEHCPQAVILVP